MVTNKAIPRPKENANPLQSGRKTTLVDPTSPPGTTGYDGPPTKGLKDHVLYLESLDRAPLHLVGLLTEDQLRQDAAYSWTGAAEYCESTAIMMERAPHLFRPTIHFTGQNLANRQERVKLLARALAQHQLLVRHFQDALIAEFSDLARMSDVSVSIVEHLAQSPVLDPGQQQNLESIAEGPLRIWRNRQAGIQEQRRQNERRKEETANVVDQAMNEALAERLFSRIRAGERPSDDEVRLAAEHTDKVATHQRPQRDDRSRSR